MEAERERERQRLAEERETGTVTANQGTLTNCHARCRGNSTVITVITHLKHSCGLTNHGPVLFWSDTLTLPRDQIGTSLIFLHHVLYHIIYSLRCLVLIHLKTVYLLSNYLRSRSPRY